MIDAEYDSSEETVRTAVEFPGGWGVRGSLRGNGILRGMLNNVDFDESQNCSSRILPKQNKWNFQTPKDALNWVN